MDFQLLFSIIVTITAIASYINHVYLKLPKTIGLTIISLLLSLICMFFLDGNNQIIKIVSNINFRDTVLNGMISYLLFAGALHVNMVDLKKELKVVVLLATIGVVISVFLVAIMIFSVSSLLNFHLSFGHCLVFGALISPTDPIIVLSVFQKSQKIPIKTKMRILGESLFNDAAGIIMFVILTSMVFYPHSNGVNLSFYGIFCKISIEAGGGILLGVLLGYVGVVFMQKSNNAEVAIFITLAISSMGYYIAQSIGVSGPISMVIAGLIIGSNCNSSKTYSKNTVRQIDNFWGMIDSVLNAFLFILIGLTMLTMHFKPMVVIMSIFGIIIIIVARYISVAVSILMIDKKVSRSYWRENILMTWGGIRGGISIALALSMPPEGNDIIGLAYIVVLMSIILQGSTIERIINYIYPKTKIKSSGK